MRFSQHSLPSLLHLLRPGRYARSLINPSLIWDTRLTQSHKWRMSSQDKSPGFNLSAGRALSATAPEGLSLHHANHVVMLLHKKGIDSTTSSSPADGDSPPRRNFRELGAHLSSLEVPNRSTEGSPRKELPRVFSGSKGRFDQQPQKLAALRPKIRALEMLNGESSAR